MRYEIYNEDSLTTDKVAPESVDLIVTSPPYNVGVSYEGGAGDRLSYAEYLDFSRKWLAKTYGWVKDTGRLCLNLAPDASMAEGNKPIYADVLQVAQAVGWVYRTFIVWDKRSWSINNTAWGSWLSASAPNITPAIELIAVMYKGAWRKQERGLSDIQKFEFMEWTKGFWAIRTEPRPYNFHPAAYPLEIPRRCIKLFSFVGDRIADPFMGSGTTIAAAVQLERVGVGVEISQRYFDLAGQRIEAFAQGRQTEIQFDLEIDEVQRVRDGTD